MKTIKILQYILERLIFPKESSIESLEPIILKKKITCQIFTHSLPSKKTGILNKQNYFLANEWMTVYPYSYMWTYIINFIFSLKFWKVHIKYNLLLNSWRWCKHTIFRLTCEIALVIHRAIIFTNRSI